MEDKECPICNRRDHVSGECERSQVDEDIDVYDGLCGECERSQVDEDIDVYDGL